SGQFQTELLFGTNKVYLTRTTSSVWDAVSPVLGNSATDLVSAVSFGPNEGYFWAGTTGGAVYFTTVGGGTSLTQFPEVDNGKLPKAIVTNITTDPNNPNAAYVTFGGTGAGGHVFFTSDGGAHWTNLTNNLPDV